MSFKKVRPAQAKPVTGRELALSKALGSNERTRRQNAPRAGSEKIRLINTGQRTNDQRSRWPPFSGCHRLLRGVDSGKGCELNSPPLLPKVQTWAGCKPLQTLVCSLSVGGSCAVAPRIGFSERRTPFTWGAVANFQLIPIWSPAVFSIHSRKCRSKQSEKRHPIFDCNPQHFAYDCECCGSLSILLKLFISH